MNVLGGERYKTVSNEVKEYMKGMYGKSPAPVDPEISKKIIGDEEVITCRPADLLEPEFDKFKKEGEEKGFVKSDEDALTYALYPPIAPKFLKGEAVEEPLCPPIADPDVSEVIPTEYSVEVDGDIFEVTIMPTGLVELDEEEKVEYDEDAVNTIEAEKDGVVTEILVEPGDAVAIGDGLMVIKDE